MKEMMLMADFRAFWLLCDKEWMLVLERLISVLQRLSASNVTLLATAMGDGKVG
jgi:hypothetical protein